MVIPVAQHSTNALRAADVKGGFVIPMDIQICSNPLVELVFLAGFQVLIKETIASEDAPRIGHTGAVPRFVGVVRSTMEVPQDSGRNRYSTGPGDHRKLTGYNGVALMSFGAPPDPVGLTDQIAGEKRDQRSRGSTNTQIPRGTRTKGSPMVDNRDLSAERLQP
jgi:hypothetical protein